MLLGLAAMELKVWVDGIQRVVCGVSEHTTCQEVVIALAQAIGESFQARWADRWAWTRPLPPGGWGWLLIPLPSPNPSSQVDGGCVRSGEGRRLTRVLLPQARRAALCLCSVSEKRSGSCCLRNVPWVPRLPVDSLPVMSSLS